MLVRFLKIESIIKKDFKNKMTINLGDFVTYVRPAEIY